MQIVLHLMMVQAVFAPSLHVCELDAYLPLVVPLMENVGQVVVGLGIRSHADALDVGEAAAWQAACCSRHTLWRLVHGAC